MYLPSVCCMLLESKGTKQLGSQAVAYHAPGNCISQESIIKCQQPAAHEYGTPPNMKVQMLFHKAHHPNPNPTMS